MRLRRVVGVLVALLIAALLGVFFFANRLIDANRGRMLAAAEAAIGRRVQIGSIGARFFGRPGLRLTGVAIADDPAFSSQPFVSASEATVVVKLWPLLERRIEVARIELRQPLVHVIRAADGRFNYATLGPLAAAPAEPAPPAPPPAPAAAPADAAAGLAWAVALFDIDDGAADFVDRTSTPPRTHAVRKIGLRASDIALDQAIQFELQAAVDGEEENVELGGVAGPLRSQDGVPFDVKGRIGPLPQMPVALKDIAAKGWAREQSVDLDQLSFAGFGGEMSGKGTLPLVDRGLFSFSGKGSGIRMEQLLPLIAPQVKQGVEGEATLDWNLRGVGRSLPALRQSLRGDASLEIRDGVLRNLNVAGEVVSRLSSLPGLSQFISRGVKPKYAAVLDRADTKFETLDLRLRFVPGGVDVTNFDLDGEDFGVTAAGNVSLDFDANLNGEVLLSRRFSEDVVADVKEARLLFNGNGQIALPFRYRGRIGEAKPQADLERLTKSVLGSNGAALLGDLRRTLKGLFR